MGTGDRHVVDGGENDAGSESVIDTNNRSGLFLTLSADLQRRVELRGQYSLPLAVAKDRERRQHVAGVAGRRGGRFRRRHRVIVGGGKVEDRSCR